jgi:Flp pilus assembly protein TadG
MLLIGVAEFGRAFLQYNTLTQAARDGARHLAGGALFGSTGTVSISGALATQTRNLVVYGNISGAGAPLLAGLTPANVTVANVGGGMVSVTAAYPYSPIFPFLPRFSYGGSVDTSGYVLQTAITIRAL